MTSLELSLENATKHVMLHKSRHPHDDGLVQNFSNPINNALETLQAWIRLSQAKGGIRVMRDRMWIFCGDYTFRVFDLHPRGIRDISKDQSKMKTLPPIYTLNIIYVIL